MAKFDNKEPGFREANSKQLPRACLVETPWRFCGAMTAPVGVPADEGLWAGSDA